MRDMTDALREYLTPSDVKALEFAELEDFLSALGRLADVGNVSRKGATRVVNGVLRMLGQQGVKRSRIVVHLATESNENLYVTDMIGPAGIGVITATIEAMIQK